MRLALPIALLAATAVALPAAAQQPAAAQIAPRVDRLEKEMRAVQRKVFPGGAGQVVEPEIAPTAAVAAPIGDPAVGRVTELGQRVDALERELQRITGQVEQNGYRVKQLEDQVKQFRADVDGRFGAMQAQAPAPTMAEPAPIATAPARPGARPAAAKPADAKQPLPKAPDETAAVPVTGDAGEDAYMAGYKLWTQKKYPEAEAALRAMVAKYPKHKRASYAQNLLGRAYLDDGKPATAATEFYTNYKSMPRGDRAPDSLYYLSQSLAQLNKPKGDQCKVYDELNDVYGATLTEPLKGRIVKARKDAGCA